MDDDIVQQNDITSELAGKKITRRQALTSAGKAAVGIGVIVVGGAAYFAGTQTAAPGAPVTVTQTATQTAPAQTVTRTVTESPVTVTPTATPEPVGFDWAIPDSAITSDLTFNIWPYRPEFVQESVDLFTGAYGEQVNLETITGDYIVTITSKFQTGQPLDMLYAESQLLGQWMGSGFVRPIDDLPTHQDYRNDIHPNFKDSFLNPFDGHYYGLTYFIGWHTPLTNQALLDQAGMAEDYPKDLFELHEFSQRIKDKGVSDTPLVLWLGSQWFELPWQFADYHAQLGAELFDSNLDPVFDTNTETAEILKLWKDATTNGLIPEDSLTTGYGDWIGKFASGTVAYMWELEYQIATYNDPAQSDFAGSFSLIPNQAGGDKWGTYTPACYFTTTANRSADESRRLERLQSFFGYRDDQGKLFISKRFMLPPSYLFSPFPEVYTDPEVKETYINQATTFRGEEDYETLQDGFLSAHTASWYWAPFAADFGSKLVQRVPSAVNGEETINSVIEALRSDAEQLKRDQAL